MSLENEEWNALDQPTEALHQLQKNSKITYTRDFLLSLSELDVCKKIPRGFDQSILSEFEDASQDRQRTIGGLSSNNFRRSEYGSSPPTKGDLNNSRGVHGRWESRSSGRSDKDNDSQLDWDSESGRHYGNQSQRSWQGPEHDGLLGSGSFPRPSGYPTGVPASKVRANDNNQLIKTNEPYHPPRPYKAVPHSRRENNDTYNNETFGSSESTDEDKVEEERKRRASFELMRRKQQKAFQEMQKLGQDKQRHELDFNMLLEGSKDEEKPLRISSGLDEPRTATVSTNDSDKSAFHSQTPASRPLIPPGFAGTVLEKKSGTKPLAPTHSAQVETSKFEIKSMQNKDNSLPNGPFENIREKQPPIQMSLSDQQFGEIGDHVSSNDNSGNVLDLSTTLNAYDKVAAMDSQQRKNSMEVFDASGKSEVIKLDAEVLGKTVPHEPNQVQSTSTLEKLFGSGLTLGGSGTTNRIERDDSKVDDAWNSQNVESSKFACWFLEDEKKQIDLPSDRPNDLLSLIVGGEKGGREFSNEKPSHHLQPAFAFVKSDPADVQMTSSVKSASVGTSNQLCSTSKPNRVPAILTCEDLEQSILSEISENVPTSLLGGQGWRLPEVGVEQPKANIDDNASQHLLSLLQKEMGEKDVRLVSTIALRTEKLHDVECVNMGNANYNLREEKEESTSNPGKSLTLEALFGSAFMQELQSVGAPVSVQRDVGGSTKVDSHGLPIPFINDGLVSSANEIGSNINSHEVNLSASIQRQQSKSDKIGRQWLGLNPQVEQDSSRLHAEMGATIGGFHGRGDIMLPKEDNFVTVGNPVDLQNFVSAGNSTKTQILPVPPNTQVAIAEKLAVFDSVFKDERSVVGAQGGPSFHNPPYDRREGEMQYQDHNNLQSSSPPFHALQNQMGMFHPLDSYPRNMNSQMKFMMPESVDHGSPPHHHFAANMLHPPFHHPRNELTAFGPSTHHPMLERVHISGNIPPPHVLQGLSRGGTMSPFTSRAMTLPAHLNRSSPRAPQPSNHIGGFMQELNPMSGFHIGQQQQSNFGGHAPPPAPDIGIGSNHPDLTAAHKLIEMERRANLKKMNAFPGHELDLSFGYR